METEVQKDEQIREQKRRLGYAPGVDSEAVLADLGLSAEETEAVAKTFNREVSPEQFAALSIEDKKRYLAGAKSGRSLRLTAEQFAKLPIESKRQYLETGIVVESSDES
jgi:hypothetical protein